MRFKIFGARLACALSLAGALAACGGGADTSQGQAKSADPAAASAASSPSAKPDVHYAP